MKLFLVAAGTLIQIHAPFGKIGSNCSVDSNGFTYTDIAPWKPYTTKEDKTYDLEQIWDAVRVYNAERRGDHIPMWIEHNVKEFGKVIIEVDGKFAMVDQNKITVL